MNAEVEKMKIFLKDQGEKYKSHKEFFGGTNNKIYILNDKYFFKIKDKDVISSEKYFINYYSNSNYYPNCYNVLSDNDFIVYDFLDAYEIEDASKIDNLINIIFDITNNLKSIETNGYGYIYDLQDSWVEFLKNETLYSSNSLNEYLGKQDFIILNKAFDLLGKYNIEKKLLHGDFGLHNAIGKDNKLVSMIDPYPVIGDWIYDLLFFIVSDITTLKLLAFDEIISMIDEDKVKVVSTLIIVLFERLKRTMKYAKDDIKEYLVKWAELKEIFNSYYNMNKIDNNFGKEN